MRIIYELKRKVAYLERQIVRLKAGNEETIEARRNHHPLAPSTMSKTDEISMVETMLQLSRKVNQQEAQLTNESVVNAQLLKKINDLEWQIVRLKAGHAAISEVRCKAIVDSEKDTERLDWLDKNMTSKDSIQTFGKEVPVGELRQYVDAAIQKEAHP